MLCDELLRRGVPHELVGAITAWLSNNAGHPSQGWTWAAHVYTTRWDENGTAKIRCKHCGKAYSFDEPIGLIGGRGCPGPASMERCT